MLILGLSKTTLLDFPGRVAATIFTGGCNFRCPFCHNKELVLNHQSVTPYGEKEIFEFLQKRKRVLTGVCITGGEPTLQNDLPDFIKHIKELGYQVKLDTNGTNPGMLEWLIKEHLIDYCAMDIKNAPEKYALTAGLLPCSKPQQDASMRLPSMPETHGILSAVSESVRILTAQQIIPYEFRTTVVKELHGQDDVLAIAGWIAGAKAYFLQSYIESDGVLCPGFHAHSAKTLETYAALCRKYVPDTRLRGIE